MFNYKVMLCFNIFGSCRNSLGRQAFPGRLPERRPRTYGAGMHGINLMLLHALLIGLPKHMGFQLTFIGESYKDKSLQYIALQIVELTRFHWHIAI